MQRISLDGIWYFVASINDKSRLIAVYFMKSKYHVRQKIKECEMMVSYITGKKIKVFRSDNEGEYKSRQFNGSLTR